MTSLWISKIVLCTTVKQLFLTWCCVIAVRVAPPATPHKVRATLATQKTAWLETAPSVNTDKCGAVSSIVMAASLARSANNRHRLQLKSRSKPYQGKESVKYFSQDISMDRSMHLIVF